MNVFAGKTGYIVCPQGDTGVHTYRVYDSLDEAESAARSKADFYHRAYEVRTAYESPARTIKNNQPKETPMSDRVKVGTSKVTFRVRAFDYPQIELASVEVDVPMYTKTDNKLDNMQQGHVTADVPDGFNEKVKDALHVFADTLQASFNEEGE